MSFEGKVVIVTGGGQGIGKGIALYLAKLGADIAIVELNMDTAREVIKKIYYLSLAPVKGLNLPRYLSMLKKMKPSECLWRNSGILTLNWAMTWKRGKKRPL